MAEEEKKEPYFAPLGSTGLKIWGGVLSEEWLLELQGSSGRKAYREMGDNDPTIGSINFAIYQMIRGATFFIEPAGKDRGQRQDAEFLDSCLLQGDLDTGWYDILSEILSFLQFGYSIEEKSYKYRRGPNAEEEWEQSRFDDGAVGFKDFSIRSQDTISKWLYDPDSGRVTGLEQSPPPNYIRRPIPLDRCLHFRTQAHKGNPEGKSIYRNAYYPWYYKKHLQSFEAIGIERNLAGMPVIYVPEKLFLDKSSAATVQLNNWKELVRKLRRDEEDGLVMPRDPDKPEKYAVELISSPGAVIDTNPVILRYDHAIAASLLADFIFLGLESKGSYALAREKRTFFEKALIAWIGLICDTFNTQAVPELFKFNGIDRPDLPKLTFEPASLPEIENVCKLLDSLARSGAMLFPDKKLEDALRAMAGLPLGAKEEE